MFRSFGVWNALNSAEKLNGTECVTPSGCLSSPQMCRGGAGGRQRRRATSRPLAPFVSRYFLCRFGPLWRAGVWEDSQAEVTGDLFSL